MSTPLTGDRRFRNDVVRIADLTVSSPRIDGYEFANCRILGPAVMILAGSTIASCGWSAPGLDAIFWEIPPGREYVVGAIEVANCVFSGCTFEGVGVAGPAEMRDVLAHGFD